MKVVEERLDEAEKSGNKGSVLNNRDIGVLKVVAEDHVSLAARLQKKLGELKARREEPAKKVRTWRQQQINGIPLKMHQYRSKRMKEEEEGHEILVRGHPATTGEEVKG